MFKKTAVALSTMMVLSGCQLTGPNVTAICTPDMEVPLATAQVESKSSDDRKVIVLPVDISFQDSADKKLKAVMRNELESQISKTGSKLVDRKIANKLKDEIKLAEQSGRYNTKGVPIADYAIITEIIGSELNKSHEEAHTATNILTGDEYLVPASCSYNVDVTAVVKVVTLPEMSLVQRIELEGDHSSKTDTRDSRCPISSASYANLASKAAMEAVDFNKDLQHLLAPTAPVLEVRQCETGTMAKVGIGSEKNIQPNDKVEFATLIKNAEGEIETFPIGEGTVVDVPRNGIKAKYSWVGISEEMSLKLHKGDAATVVPKECSVFSLSDFECGLENMVK